MTALPTWITDPALADAWVRIRDRFEKSGLVPTGRVQLAVATREQRHALGGLLGRSITTDAVRVDLGDLDRRLRNRSGASGLLEVLTRLHGHEPQDRPEPGGELTPLGKLPLIALPSSCRPPGEQPGWIPFGGPDTSPADGMRW